MAERRMIRLFQFAPALGLPNASPFCLKLETWLRMAGLDYEVVITPDPRKTPLGKLPVIEHDGRHIADSGCAIAYLEKACNVRLNASLNPAERAHAHALMRMIEEHDYWAALYFRWLDDSGWEATREAFFGSMNPVARGIATRLVRSKIRRDARGHGLALHSADEICRRFEEDMKVLAVSLGERPYFGGYQPANIDASAYGLLAQVLQAELRTPLRELAGQHPNLLEYVARMRERYFRDYA